MKCRILTLLLSLLATVSFADVNGAAARQPGVMLYVATNGDDSWTGSLAEPNAGRTDGPLATLGAARDLLRRKNPAGGARVLVRGGIYRLQKPLAFTAADSGTDGAPRSYESYPGENVTIAGTRVLTGKWQSVGPNVYVLDVGAAANAGESFRTLFVDGKRATWARFPNRGYILATGGKGKSVIELPSRAAKPSWAADPNATVNIIAEHGWYNEIVRVNRVSQAGDRIELSGRELQGSVLAGNRFYVEGVREELDEEGEWYLDRKAAKLYYCSRASPEGRRIEAAVVDRLVDVRGTVGQPVHDLAFRALEFFGSDFTVDHVAVRTTQDAAVHLVNAHNVEIADCRFVSVGGYAVWLHLDSRGNVIRHNEVVDGGSGGVLLTGARFSYLSDQDVYDASPDVQEVAPIGNVIAENHIHHGGAVRAYCSGVHLDSRPLALSAAQGNYIGFNHIHDMPRNGIFAFRNQGGNVIEANDIHDVLQRTNDGGAIHLASMNPLCAPTYLLGNRICHIGYLDDGTSVPKALGIYADWYTSKLIIRDNIITDTHDGGIRLLGGNDVTMEGNLVGDDPTASVVFGTWTTNVSTGFVFRGNTVVNGKGRWVRYFTGSSPVRIDTVVQHPSDFWQSVQNVYWGRDTGGGILIAKSQRDDASQDRMLTLADIQERGAERGSVVRRPESAHLNVSTNPEQFGLGSETIERMKHPRSTEDAKAWLRRLEHTAAFVSFDDAYRVARSADWRDEPTKINEYLAFAGLKQAQSHTSGGTISFSADLEPGEYDVFVRWYGSPAERAPLIELELAAPGAQPQTVRIDHRQEAHKWLKVGAVKSNAPGRCVLTARGLGGGLSAMDAVAWVKRQSP